MADLLERPGSPQEQYTAQEGKVVRTVLVPWRERWQHIRDWLKPPFVQQRLNLDVSRNEISREIPLTEEETREWIPLGIDEFGNLISIRSEPWLYATDILSVRGIKPLGKNANDVMEYEWAEVEISFEKRSYVVRSDEEMRALYRGRGDDPDDGRFSDYGPSSPPASGKGDIFQRATHGETGIVNISRAVTRIAQPNSRVIHFPFGKMFYDNDGKVAINGVVAVEPHTEVILTWHDVPTSEDLIWKQVRHIASFTGAVNSINFFGYDSGRLLFNGMGVTKHFSCLGHRLSNFIMRFGYVTFTDAWGLPTEDHNAALRVGQSNTARPETWWFYERITTDGKQVFIRNAVPGSDKSELFKDGNTLYPGLDFRNIFIDLPLS